MSHFALAVYLGPDFQDSAQQLGEDLRARVDSAIRHHERTVIMTAAAVEFVWQRMKRFEIFSHCLIVGN